MLVTNLVMQRAILRTVALDELIVGHSAKFILTLLLFPTFL
jgi:hypothetical protein